MKKQSIYGVDPGKKSPAFVCIDYQNRTHMSSTPFLMSEAVSDWEGEEIVFIETQYARPKSSRKSLMELCFWAGTQAGFYMAHEVSVYGLSPFIWKAALMRSGNKLPKEVFQNRLKEQGLIPQYVWEEGHDTVDAYLIAIAGMRMMERGDLPPALEW